ncbi:hypothetical protein [uncultured Clostridium sp.]|uniref:hypothetical protein n=1 Tax=uncultured Clostridium sp. TaxID=59620 RepID=UPI0026113ED1|nr:hypothetical protein [uncultured Clostridium sp.]
MKNQENKILNVNYGETNIVIPPLKVFMGWNPMKEWISKCKAYPLVYKDILGNYGTGISIINIDFKPLPVANRIYEYYIERLDQEMEIIRNSFNMNLYLKNNDGKD